MKNYLLTALSLAVFGAAQAANPVVVIETSMGNIKVELFEDKAPVTVKNFLAYVDDKHFDGTIFHRVMRDFMIQGGGIDAKTKKEKADKKPPIVNESTNGLSNARGTIAMARTSAPHSATAQFFINVVDNGKLDKNQSRDGYGYCVFGKVVDGMDVVEKIRNVKVTPGSLSEAVPNEDILIKTVRRAEKDKDKK